LVLIVVAAILGNGLVCLAVYCNSKLRNMFNYFLVSLAISDLMSALFIMPMSIFKTSTDHVIIPKLMCVTWYSLDVLFTSSSICHLCMISVDRYLTLTYPLKYGHSKKKKHTLMKIALVWIISICIAGPLFALTWIDKEPLVNGTDNSRDGISFYLPLLIMTIMYALTVRALRLQVQERRRLEATTTAATTSRSSTATLNIGDNFSKKSSFSSSFRISPSFRRIVFPNQKRKASAPAVASMAAAADCKQDLYCQKVLGILFVVFVACYLPFFALYLVRGVCDRCRPYITVEILVALEWVAYSAALINPIIYHVFNPDFRRTFQQLLRCRC
ncbi:hypothetical protein HELRODRAFT_121581, partial [Helobdella robusta]